MRLGGPRGSKFATFRRGSSAKSRRCSEQLLGWPLDATLATETVGTQLALGGRSAAWNNGKIWRETWASSPKTGHTSIQAR